MVPCGQKFDSKLYIEFYTKTLPLSIFLSGIIIFVLSSVSDFSDGSQSSQNAFFGSSYNRDSQVKAQLHVIVDNLKSLTGDTEKTKKTRQIISAS